MKTSNKILLGTVVTAALILTAIHVALYAKYKRGDLVTVQQLHEERYDKHVMSGVTKINVSGLANFEVIPSDTLRLEIEKQDKKPEITFEQRGDSLIIKGGTIYTKTNGEVDKTRSYYSTILYLPSNTSLSINECEARIKGTADTLKAVAYTIEAWNSSLNFGETRNGKPNGSYFKSINAVADKSNVLFFNDVMIGNLSLSLVNGETEDQGMQVEIFSLNADSNSTVSLKGTNLKKLMPVIKP